MSSELIPRNWTSTSSPRPRGPCVHLSPCVLGWVRSKSGRNVLGLGWTGRQAAQPLVALSSLSTMFSVESLRLFKEGNPM